VVLKRNEMEIKLELDRSYTELSPWDKVCIKGDKDILFAQNNCKYVSQYKAFVEINGKVYEERTPSKKVEADCCFITSRTREICPTVFYKGRFYYLHFFGGLWNQQEIGDAYSYLVEMDKDLKTYGMYGENFSKVRLLKGNTAEIIRTITLQELQMTWLELKAKAKEFGGDCKESMTMFMEDLCGILKIPEGRYKSGKYNLNDQMIKRLHSKIQYETQNSYR
jgi:hypothetical protein